MPTNCDALHLLARITGKKDVFVVTSFSLSLFLSLYMHIYIYMHLNTKKSDTLYT